MHADDVHVVVAERQLEKGMAGQERPAPHRPRDRHAGQEPERLPAVRAVSAHARVLGQRPHDVGPRRFLQHDHVRRAAADDRGNRVDATDAAMADVVGEQAHRHGSSGRSSSVSVSGFSSKVRYG